MSGGMHIAAVDAGAQAPQAIDETHPESAAPILKPDDWDAVETFQRAESGLQSPELDLPEGEEWTVPAMAGGAIAIWTLFFLWAEQDVLFGGMSARDAVNLLTGWAIMPMLGGVAWLLLLRTSRREAIRFGATARLLSAESTRLEARLLTVNRELSLAREFIAAQSRDLESLGRLATERLSENADRLQGLIRDNGAQVEAIATVSSTAVDNMDKLRGELPVIASSTKDLANTIGHAGRTAQAALDELVAGMDRLNQSSQAGDQHVTGLQGRIDSALSLFDSRLEQIDALVTARIDGLEQRGTALRDRLGADEADALAALERRAQALGEEFDRTRTQLETQEAEALTSLRARLAALRDEGNALARSLRDGESGAMEALLAAKQRVEAEISGVVERLDRLDRDAIEAASRRIQSLSDEASAFDARLAERNQQFAAEIEQRLAQAGERHEAEVSRLDALFVRLDTESARRLDQQGLAQRELDRSAEAITQRLEALSERIAAISAFGNQAEEALGNSLSTLANRLGASREALSGTDTAIAGLTDGAVRLLELLQASTAQSREALPSALADGEQALTVWEQRLTELHGTLQQAGVQGGALADTTAQTRDALAASLDQVSQLQGQIDHGNARHAEALAEIRTSLGELDQETSSLADRAARQLAAAIESLAVAARTTVSQLGDDSAGAVKALADRIGDETAGVIERVMRLRMAESVGALEQAASHAAGVSREAAIQLRDQLGKVAELTSNLEQRVAHARSRAEEQVDNDFSRRVALITEALNSNAIDIAKALSVEVTDTSWAAYLKGDRGVFTRRALKLVESAETKEIAGIYESDAEFRSHVSRYIHDFEAMLRQLLSTRDGHALGVTVLSSDMGKLYVVLAQSIERLRN